MCFTLATFHVKLDGNGVILDKAQEEKHKNIFFSGKESLKRSIVTQTDLNKTQAVIFDVMKKAIKGAKLLITSFKMLFVPLRRRSFFSLSIDRTARASIRTKLQLKFASFYRFADCHMFHQPKYFWSPQPEADVDTTNSSVAT